MSTLGGLFTLIGQMGHSSGDYWCNMQIYLLQTAGYKYSPLLCAPCTELRAGAELLSSTIRYQEPEKRMLHLVCYSNSLFQIKHRSGIDSAKDTLVLFLQPIRSLYQEN